MKSQIQNKKNGGIGVALVQDTRSNDARFMHKLYFSLHARNRLAGDIQPTFIEKLKDFTE